MGLHRCSCEESGVTQAAEYPRAIFVLAPGLPPSVGRSTSPPDRLWAPSRVGGELALLDVCAKKFGIRTFWHNLALRLPVRAELRTVCRGYHGFLCGLPRGPGGGPGGPGCPDKPHARDPARQVATAGDLGNSTRLATVARILLPR